MSEKIHVELIKRRKPKISGITGNAWADSKSLVLREIKKKPKINKFLGKIPVQRLRNKHETGIIHQFSQL